MTTMIAQATEEIRKGDLVAVVSRANGKLLVRRAQQGDKAAASPAGCMHRVRELPAKHRPFKYQCEGCGERQKILNGLNLDALERQARAR